VNSLTIPFVMIVLVAIGLLALSGWFATRRAFAPVEQITEAAYRIGVNKNLTERIEIDLQSNDEVARLGRAFNTMLDQLEKSFKSQKQFIADSSHELRTPLTVIRGNLDLLKRNPDPKNQTESLRAMERETERMQRLVEDLLLLAQADARQIIEMHPLQLDTLVLDVYMNTRVLADARHQTLKLGHFDPVALDGDAERLKRAILNLVDNAIKYTPEAGTITVSLYKGKKWARVVVADTGIGIAEKDQTLIFDRFYRVDKARSRGSGSTGLGLAIVRHIAEAHSGRVTLESEAGKGSTFTLWLNYKPTDEADFSDEIDLDLTDIKEPVL
jgi:signal transduction histidine kinase